MLVVNKQGGIQFMIIKKSRFISLIAVIFILVFTMAACDNPMYDDGEEVVQYGDLIVSTELEGGIFGSDSFSDFEIIVKIDHQDINDNYEKGSGALTYSEIKEENSIAFENIAIGAWDIEVTVKADHDDYGTNVIARQVNDETAVVFEKDSTTENVNIEQESGSLKLIAGLGISSLDELNVLELEEANTLIKDYFEDGSLWEELDPQTYDLSSEITKNEVDYADELSIKVLPGITKNCLIAFTSNSLTVGLTEESPPPAPTGVSAEVDNINETIEIEWNPVTNANNYNVVRRDPDITDDQWETIETDLSESSYTDDTAQDEETYEYAVLAVDADGLVSDFSEPSNEVGIVSDKIYNENTSETYTTIQAAIDAAEEGQKIIVKAGTYTEDLTLTDQDTADNVSLEGKGPDETSIEGNFTIENGVQSFWMGHFEIIGDLEDNGQSTNINDIHITSNSPEGNVNLNGDSGIFRDGTVDGDLTINGDDYTLEDLIVKGEYNDNGTDNTHSNITAVVTTAVELNTALDNGLIDNINVADDITLADRLVISRDNDVIIQALNSESIIGDFSEDILIIISNGNKADVTIDGFNLVPDNDDINNIVNIHEDSTGAITLSNNTASVSFAGIGFHVKRDGVSITGNTLENIASNVQTSEPYHSAILVDTAEDIEIENNTFINNEIPLYFRGGNDLDNIDITNNTFDTDISIQLDSTNVYTAVMTMEDGNTPNGETDFLTYILNEDQNNEFMTELVGAVIIDDGVNDFLIGVTE